MQLRNNVLPLKHQLDKKCLSAFQFIPGYPNMIKSSTSLFSLVLKFVLSIQFLPRLNVVCHFLPSSLAVSQDLPGQKFSKSSAF